MSQYPAKMLRYGSKSLPFHLKRFSTRASKGLTHGATVRKTWARNGIIFVSSSTLIISSLYAFSPAVVYNDSPPIKPIPKVDVGFAPAGSSKNGLNPLEAIVWGSNRSNTLLLEESNEDGLHTPTIANWLEGVALRHLVLHQRHAACVDSRGDVYQWGDGFFGTQATSGRKPQLTLKGKDIIALQATESRVYALSASGTVYAFSSETSRQAITQSRTPWWGTGWYEEEERIDYIEIAPKEKLGRGERFVSLAAGNDHLLALTSVGRAFAHPVNKQANAYGQLGFRKFNITSSANPVSVELIPKSIADPYFKSTRVARINPIPTMSENLIHVDDSSIRFCSYLFEIPALRGVEIAQVAAGGRSSFVRTKSGQVLGWGANEYGQIGLGNNVVVDTITVPTEVVLWRNTPRAQTKCLNISAGGDLTAFTIERTSQSSKTYELLMCGNGQWGGLGNNIFSNSQGNPLRVKNVSGLHEYSDQTQSLQPIMPLSVAISPTGHVLLTLKTGDRQGKTGYDLMVWGKNHDSELGNGKKSSLPVPTVLTAPDGERFMLRSREVKDVRDLQGKVWQRKAKVEQHAAAGYGSSVVYWKVSS
ncbi:regulator of chromosome condensation 1/beta-lactamase-inhibitor protein II [Infundibulicybe gibba]|nr:regulator of chromosome condensation 1/beta-lactamase-inhibitor protein II [Infundibulicybe gibba]